VRPILGLLFCLSLMGADNVERWGVYEVTLNGPPVDNAYVDIHLSARFRFRNRAVDVDGFYDGDGVYRVRFMPDEIGEWTYTTTSNAMALDGAYGKFTVIPPSPANHGPVRVRYVTHFGYEDGTPYVPIGTTCYAWVHQGDQLEEQTDLEALGIEADLILFHPYDRWGYSNMPPDVNDRYLRYIVARLAAYRNVWWSLANEYDFVRSKTMADWDHYFRLIQEIDPYQHLRSIHNSGPFYDHSKPWVTHVSVQSSDLEKAREYVAQYRKPVVYDECKYEGNIPKRWGNISAQELVRRFWIGTVSGAYVGHGETYLDPNDVLWWSKGGVLKGESPKRIAFLRKILDGAPVEGLNNVSTYYLGAGREGRYYLFYFDVNQPANYEFDLARGVRYRADLIDPWEMTITPVEGTFEGRFTMKLPGKPYLAVRFEKAN